MVTLNETINNYLSNYCKKTVGKKILDVGCGTGNYTFIFGTNNIVTGIDLQNVVKQKYLNFNFQIGDATDMQFRNNHFDVVISFDVIEHIEEDKKMISECYRVLKERGKLLLGTPNKTRLSNVLLKLTGKKITYPLNLWTDKDLGPIIHIREYTANEMEGLLEDVGFKSIRANPLWLGIPVFKYGLVKIPQLLHKYCHYLFIKAVK